MHTKLKIFTYCLSNHGQRTPLCRLPPPTLLPLFWQNLSVFLFSLSSLFFPYYTFHLTALYHTHSQIKSQLTLVFSSFQAILFWLAVSRRGGGGSNCIHLCHFNAFMHSLNVHPPRETRAKGKAKATTISNIICVHTSHSTTFPGRTRPTAPLPLLQFSVILTNFRAFKVNKHSNEKQMGKTR